MAQFAWHAPLARIACVVFLLAVAPGSVAWAQARTDVIILANGDRLTGEVIELERGRLELKTDDAGTIAVEWTKIARIAAARSFEVETSDGRRWLGSLESRADLSVLVTGPEANATLAMSEVTHLIPIGASLLSRIDGSVAAGFSYTRSSGIAQTTLNSDGTFRRPAFQVRLATSVTLTKRSDQDQRDDRGTLSLSYTRYRGQRWLVAGSGTFETNESLGLKLRSQVGLLVGQRLVNSNRAQVEAGAGLAVNEEQGVNSDATQNVEMVFDFRTSYFTYDRPKTDIGTTVQYYPSLSSWGRQRLQLDSSVKRELWKDFFAAINLYDTFDSAPPNPGAERNDVGLVISAGWSF